MAVKLTIRRIPMIVAPFAASGIFDVSCRRRKVVYLNKLSVRIAMTWRFLRNHASRPPPANRMPGRPAPTMGPGTSGNAEHCCGTNCQAFGWKSQDQTRPNRFKPSSSFPKPMPHPRRCYLDSNRGKNQCHAASGNIPLTYNRSERH
jgi:hypothetical protein